MKFGYRELLRLLMLLANLRGKNCDSGNSDFRFADLRTYMTDRSMTEII